MIAPEAEPKFSLEINGKAFINWTEIEFEEALDAFSTLAFTAPFEPTNRAFRDTFRPFAYPQVRLFVDDELQFTGRLMNVEPGFGPDNSSVKVQCAALPEVLCICRLPIDFKKREFKKIHLLAIAKDLCPQFGFNARLADDVSAAALEKIENSFRMVRIDSEEPVHSFLCKLAQQRDLVMTDDEAGNLLFQRSVSTGNATLSLTEGQPPLQAVSVQFNPQEYYSEVTVMVPQKRGQKAGTWTEHNPHYAGLIRPITIKCEDIRRGDGPAAARGHLGRMFGNAARWDVTLPTIRDSQGRLLEPNTTITLQAPSAMVYGRHEFLVRTVTKRQSVDSTSSTLGLVLPGSFSGEPPPVLPWNEALA